jgi:septum formation inhibitor-activating ATPase MinD
MSDYIILTKLDKTILNTIFQVIKNNYKHSKFLVKQKSNKRLYLFYRPGIAKKNIPIIKKKYLA